MSCKMGTLSISGFTFRTMARIGVALTVVGMASIVACVQAAGPTATSTPNQATMAPGIAPKPTAALPQPTAARPAASQPPTPTNSPGAQPSKVPETVLPLPPTPAPTASSQPGPGGSPGQSQGTPQPPAKSEPVPPSARQQVDLAKQDLAKRLNVPVERIAATKVVEIVWPDAALGCPEPGRMYATVLMDGFQITLEADGKTFEYHTDRGTRLVLCQKK